MALTLRVLDSASRKGVTKSISPTVFSPGIAEKLNSTFCPISTSDESDSYTSISIQTAERSESSKKFCPSWKYSPTVAFFFLTIPVAFE